MAQYPPPGPPQYPQGQGFPPPPPGYGQQGPHGYPPQGYDPPQGQYAAPPPTGQRRGCRGCLFGCLATFLVVSVIGVILIAAGIFMFRQAYPTMESFGEATTCAGLRIGITVIEAGLNDSEMTAEERATAQTMLREARAEFEKNCGPLR